MDLAACHESYYYYNVWLPQSSILLEMDLAACPESYYYYYVWLPQASILLEMDLAACPESYYYYYYVWLLVMVFSGFYFKLPSISRSAKIV